MTNANAESDNTQSALYGIVRERLCDELGRLGSPDPHKECRAIELRLALGAGGTDIDDSDRDAFLASLQRVESFRRVEDGCELNTFVREFQALVNHRPSTTNASEATTRFIEEIIDFKRECRLRQPEDLAAYLSLTLASHRAVDQFLSTQHARESAERKQTIARIREQGIDPAEFYPDGENREINTQFASVTHHVLDWYLRVSPHLAYRKSSEKVAAIALYCASRYSSGYGGIALYPPFRNEDLSAFGGWKGAAGINSGAFTAYYDILRSAHDPALLSADPHRVPYEIREFLEADEEKEKEEKREEEKEGETEPKF